MNLNKYYSILLILIVLFSCSDNNDNDGNSSPGSETEEVNRVVDKTYWDWPVAPDAIPDPYHVEWK